MNNGVSTYQVVVFGAERNLKKVIFLRQGSGFHKTQFTVQMPLELSSGPKWIFQKTWEPRPSRVSKKKEAWPFTVVGAELKQSTPKFLGTGCV